MSVKHKRTRFDISSGNVKALLVAVVLSTAVLGAGAAEADKAKPKPQPATSESLTLNFEKVTITYLDQTPGPSVVMQGLLHLVSQALLSQDGAPVGFTLHGNLADAFAVTVDGAQSFVAVGADGIPADCTDSENLFFDLTVIPQYDADGTLLSACVVGQDGCEPPDELE